MERLLLTLVVLVVIGASATMAELPGLEARTRDVIKTVRSEDWVRTTRGWEDSSRWRESPVTMSSHRATVTINPLVLGSLQLLISITALWSFSKQQRAQG